MPQEVSPTGQGAYLSFLSQSAFFCAHDEDLGISTPAPTQARHGEPEPTRYLGSLANSVSTPGKSFFPRRFHTVRQTQ
jgi:hypothetical protein